MIVTNEGDSIACNIDSITDAYIYFEMRSNYTWTHTHMDMDKVSEFKRLELDRKTSHLKPGTSILLPSDQVPPGSGIPKNGFYVELFPINRTEELGYISLNYERLFGKRKRGSIRIAVYPNFNRFISFLLKFPR